MSIVENLAKASTTLLIKTHAEEINEALFLEGSLRGLLIEALDDSDKSEMETAIKDTLALVNEFASSLPKDGDWSSITGPISSKFDASQIVALYDETADPKARADAAANVTKTFQDAAGEMAAVVNCITQTQEALKAFKPEDGTKTIGELSEEGDDKSFPTQDKIIQGIEKAYQIPDAFQKAWSAGSKEAEAESGGILKKIGNFLKGLFGGDKPGNIVPPGDIVKPILASPFDDFMNVNVQAIQQKLAETTKAIGTETAEVSGAAAAAQQGKDAAASGKADPKAAEAGVAALKQDKDTASDVLAAVKGASEQAFAALQAALGGKMDALSPKDQTVAQRVLQMFQAGPDGANPEDAAKAATDAVEDADKEIEGSVKNASALADLGDKHLGDGGGDLVRGMLSDPDAQKLFAHKANSTAYLHEAPLAALLFEQEDGIPLADVVTALAKAGEVSGKAPGEEEVKAWAKAVNDGELLSKKISLGEEGAESEEGALSGDEAEKEQDAAQSELEGAAKEAASQEVPPAVAVAQALDSWMSGLSDTSQKSLQAKGRMDGLKDVINQALDSAAKAIEDEVAAAVDLWRGEHEETLMKSKRFAKKNFDSLSELIPQIAAQMLKVTAESNTRLTRTAVHRTVYRYLDRRFRRDAMLLESNRWQKLAGINTRKSQ